MKPFALASLIAFSGALLISNHAVCAPKLLYSSLEAEAAEEYQVGSNAFGSGYLRFIGRAELALTDEITAKLTASPCGGPYSNHATGVTECSVQRLLEELTVNGVLGDFDFSIGRQIVTQGNTEGFILLDRLNGRDYCRFARLDIQNKLPNWLGKGRVFLNKNTSLSFTFAPFSANSYLPQTGSDCEDRFHNAGQFDGLSDSQNNDIADWAGGAELSFSRGLWSATLNVITTREDIFVLETIPYFQKTRPRTLWLGGTAAATLGSIVVRGELAYAPNRDFTIAPQELGGLLAQGSATNGIDQRNNLLLSLGAEWRNDNWYWALQYFFDHVDAGIPLIRTNESHMSSLRVRRTFFNDQLAFDGFAIADMSDNDFAIRSTLSYEINEKTSVIVGGTAYSDMGGATGLLGSYAGRESVFIKVKRTLF